jgi:CIC family chloride channel protein
MMDPLAQAEPCPLNHLQMICLALIVGVMSGAGAFAFRLLVNFFSNIAFHHPLLSAHPVLIIFIPMLGACVVSFLVTHLSRESRGHGVPEVVYAIQYKKFRLS